MRPRANKLHPFLFCCCLLTLSSLCMSISAAQTAPKKHIIHALYIPLADHYAALVAKERYQKDMLHTHLLIERMRNWDILRAYFQTGDVDMAFIMSPLAMDMFLDKPNFRWVGLMHRDGTALAINEELNKLVELAENRLERKPGAELAKAIKDQHQQTARKIEIGVPHLKSTHTVVLHQYLKQHNVRLSLHPRVPGEALAVDVPPPEAPIFLRRNSNRGRPVAFEQGLPWADVAETGGFGRLAWYSKDVMDLPHGHVECIAIASDHALRTKQVAVREIMYFIRKAGEDIEKARNAGGDALEEIVRIIQRYIPEHSREAILASLDPRLEVINYRHLGIDKPGLKQIMDLAVESGVLPHVIDIDAFALTPFIQDESHAGE